jgi:sulfate adenylyltransferase subunit 1
VAGGVFKPGDEVQVVPSGFSTKVRAVHSYDQELGEAFAPLPLPVTLTLDSDIDISRGDMLVKNNNPPRCGHDLEAMICVIPQFSDAKPARRHALCFRGARRVPPPLVRIQSLRHPSGPGSLFLIRQ